jgi:hypothetical protein
MLQVNSISNDDLTEMIRADDRAWFYSNPGKVYRLRNFVPGEFGEGIDTGFVIVARAADHTTIRQGVNLPMAFMKYVDGCARDCRGRFVLRFRDDIPKDLLRREVQAHPEAGSHFLVVSEDEQPSFNHVTPELPQ